MKPNTLKLLFSFIRALSSHVVQKLPHCPGATLDPSLLWKAKFYEFFEGIGAKISNLTKKHHD